MSGFSRKPDSIQLQERDIALLRCLFESRVMTSAQIGALFFDGKREAAKKRLQKLKITGLLTERPRSGYEPSTLFLTRKALTMLREQGMLAEYPALEPSALEKRSRVGNLTIRHELEVMDVKVAFHRAVAHIERATVAEFSTWPAIYEFEAFRLGYNGKEMMVKPDAFIRIHEREADGGLSEHTFFLEVDRSTETQDTLVAKAGCYLDYYKSGGFAVRNGATRSEFKEYPFRVLMVFKTAERRNNTAERLVHHVPPILTQVCLSTLAEVQADPLGPIWMSPKDYREATMGTRFAAPRRQEGRQPERDLLVSERVKCTTILW
jgi:hypothetical protein